MKQKKIIILVVLMFICINVYTLNFYTKGNITKKIKDSFYVVISNIKKTTKQTTFLTLDLLPEIKKLKSEIDRLQKTLELNSTISSFNYVNTTLINRNNNYWYNTIIVDKGEKDGIKVNSPAIIKDGLLGKVIETTKSTSTIELLSTSDYTNKISVKINNKDTYGLITSYDFNTNTYSVEEISTNNEINIGDSVYTTGLSDIYPGDILIGTVKEITYDNFELTKSLKVTPSVNFNKIDYITIII